MASSKGDSAVLNLGEMGEEGLNFTSSNAPGGSGLASTTHTFEGQVPDSALDIEESDLTGNDDKVGLLDGEKKPTNYNFWSTQFYSQFFDVDTKDVKERLIWGVFPRPTATPEFVRKSIRPNPDLYGPFWVCVTLIFSVAISGNVASYLQAALTAKDDSVRGFRWHYDFHKVTLAASAVFGYAWCVPAGLYAAMWAKAGTTSTNVSITELLCIYGYSLSIFIPISVLWTIQNSALQWALVAVAFAVSGAVLVLALWNNMIKDNVNKNVGVIIIVVVIGLHLLLTLGFMLYFFHVPNTAVQTVDPNASAQPDTSDPSKFVTNNAKVPEAPPKVDKSESASQPKRSTSKEKEKETKSGNSSEEKNKS